MKNAWTGLITALMLGLIIFVAGLPIGGWYLGWSDRATGSIIHVNDGRPTVEYTVDTKMYQQVTSQHGPQFAEGQQLTLCYNPHNPAQAQTCSSRAVMTVFCGVGSAGLIVAVVIAIWMVVQRRAQPSQHKRRFVDMR